MNEKNRNLILRITSALLLLPLVLWLLWMGGLWTTLLVALAILLVTAELYGMGGISLRHPAALLGLVASASMAWFAASVETYAPGMLGILLAAPLVALSLYTLLPPQGDLGKAARAAPFVALAPTYVGLGLGAIVALRALPGEQGITWTLIALGVTWGNDTGAYFAGRLFGKRKFYPLVSPNKTWEGFLGGMATSVLVCLVIRWLLDPSLTLWDCGILGVVGGILGPVGDLSESMLKRAFGVKDSGKLLPGHGGIYDRADALLFVAPWVFAYQYYFRGLL